jgi:serine/threonine protein kinase
MEYHIDQGSFGTVLVKNNKAIKIFNHQHEHGIINPLEIELLKRVRHPNLIQCEDLYISNRGIEIIMKLYEKNNGHHKFNRRTTTWNDVAYYIFQLIDAVLFLQENNIYHFDVKPENTLYDGNHLILCDYGMARIVNDQMIQNGYTDIERGTTFYCPPEGRANNNYSVVTDSWSIGMTILYMISGRFMFKNRGEVCNLNGQCLPNSYVTHIKRCCLECTSDDSVRDHLQYLLLSLIQPLPEKRMKLSDLIKSPLFSSFSRASGACILKPEYTTLSDIDLNNISTDYKLMTDHMRRQMYNIRTINMFNSLSRKVISNDINPSETSDARRRIIRNILSACLWISVKCCEYGNKNRLKLNDIGGIVPWCCLKTIVAYETNIIRKYSLVDTM